MSHNTRNKIYLEVFKTIIEKNAKNNQWESKKWSKGNKIYFTSHFVTWQKTANDILAELFWNFKITQTFQK